MANKKVCSVIALLLVISAVFAQGVEKKVIRWSKGSSINEYLEKHSGAAFPDEEIYINASDYCEATQNADISMLQSFEGKDNVLSWKNEEGTVSWNFSVKATGFYHLSLEYIPLPLKGMSIEFEVSIDGEVPNEDFRSVRFPRMWRDSYEVRRDKNGNDLVSDEEEVFCWSERDFIDTEGFYNKSLPLYIEEGSHTLSLTLKREALCLKGIKIYNPEEIPSYSQVLMVRGDRPLSENRGDRPQKRTKGDRPPFQTKIQAETPSLKSDSVLIPTSDRIDAATEPSHPSKIRLNTIGGNWTWKLPGQWVEYTFEVPEDGQYAIYFKGRQNFQRGMSATRQISIDGDIPFKEFENLEFAYDLSWHQVTARDPKTGAPCLVSLKKGTHTLRLESVLGRLTPILTAIEDLNYECNSLSRRFVMIMGSEPDHYRDYQLEKEIPGLLDKLKELADRYEEQADNFEKIAGQAGSEAQTIRIMVDQLRSFVKKPQYIQDKQTSFRDNIANLATWILYRKETPLELDYITVAAPGAKIQKAKSSWFKQRWMNIRSFIASFVEDYNSVGGKEKNAVTVWISSGRDQAQILRNLITNDFTPKTGIKVNLSLVQGSLIEATMADRGPEIAIQVARGQPVNLAARNALYDLSTFSDFDQVVSERYNDGAMIPYEYRGGTYALPLEQNYHMMFYRTDIFEELGIEPPETWEDLYKIIPVLQRNNMEIGLPFQQMDGQNLIDAGMGARNIFPTLLAQHGGDFYINGDRETGLMEPDAYAAFKQWTDFYSAYGFNLKFDLNTRFRSGIMPIGIENYGMYNMLMYSAPEIRNCWAMAPVPGIRNEDGTINRTESASGSAIIMFKKIKNPDAGWEFLKWWTSADIQLKYATQMETLMGAAARVCTANKNTFERMGWSKSEQEILKSQWQYVKEVPEVPGGYYTIRMLDTAFTYVYYNNANPRGTLIKYCEMINEEITRKRKELGIDE